MILDLNMFNKLIRPLRNRVLNSLARAVVETVDDTKKMQLMKIGLFADETRSDVERVQNYGFTSVPFADAEAAVIFPGGSREHGLIVAVDDRKFRLKGLENGEVAIYTDEKDKIHLKRGNVIDVETKTLNITATDAVNINTKDYTLNATGNIIENAVDRTETLSGKKVVNITGDNTETVGGKKAETITGNSELTALNRTETITTLRTITVPNSQHSTNITTPLLTVTALAFGGGGTASGNLVSTGEIKAAEIEDTVGKLSALRSVYNSHTHNETGSTTGTPNQTDP